MQKILRKLLIQLIRDLDTGNTNLSEEEEKKIIDTLQEIRTESTISKYQAYTYLGMSRAKFDNNVKEGLIPHGIKIEGFKELRWKKSDLKKLLNNK